MSSSESLLRRWFTLVVDRPWIVIAICLALIAAMASFAPRIEKDTGADAFIDPDSPALVDRQKVEELFGLKDPIVAAVTTDEVKGIYREDVLLVIKRLTEQIESLPNVDPERVTSLATEKNIVGTQDGIIVEGFFAEDAEHFKAPFPSPPRAEEIAAAVADFPLYQGSLVARDGSASLIVAELMDEDEAEATYEAVRRIAEEADLPDGVVVRVAGEGAVSGYLQTYIDRDARKLNPLAGLIITTVLLLAFRSLRGAVLPNLIVLGTVAGTFGLMGLLGVDFYVITNGLIVNLIGIAVADSIHVFSQYYDEQRADPEADKRDLVIRAMTVMARPITLTTVTTISGFLALAAANSMPPVVYFGLFGAIGVALAWLYSVTLLPACMSAWPRKRLPRIFQPATGRAARPRVGLMPRVGTLVTRRPGAVATAGLVVGLVGLAGLSQVEVNDARIENFQESEPLYQADKAINREMDGTYYLDVLVQADEVNGLHQPEALRRIEALQEFLVTLPGVNGTSSIVDYVKQLHRAVNKNRPSAYRIPDDPLLISQLFFLYNASADPTDFEEEVDARYTRALVRARVARGDYANNKIIVPAAERYLEETFNAPGLTATVTGRLDVDYHWIDGIASSAAMSILLSLAAVTGAAMLIFRSAVGGVIAVLPVFVSVLIVYAVMGFLGIPLGVGTSMFSAIAIGLGVDFAIHTIERIRTLTHAHGISRDSLAPLYATTGRALLFNFIALAGGFGVLATSDVPPLVEFGTLVAVAVGAAFIAAMTVAPALVLLMRPRFLHPSNEGPQTMHPRSASTSVHLIALVCGALLFGPAVPQAFAGDGLSGREIVEKIDARPDGQRVTRRLTFEKTDRSGVTIVEEAVGYRRYFGEDKRTMLFYLEPTTIRGTGFLTFDYADPSVDDDQWLYLPALRKIRRISASDRGGYFLGTDFTYEEIKKEQKIELADYEFEARGEQIVDGVRTLVVSAVPVDPDIADELGYSRVVYRVDPEIWMSRKSDYYDLNGNHLKTITLNRVEIVDGITTATDVLAENHKTGHSTRLTFDEIDYDSQIPSSLFTQSRLRRGL